MTAHEMKFPAYSLSERDRRWNIANRLMEEEHVDGLIVYGDREGAFPATFAQMHTLQMNVRARLSFFRKMKNLSLSCS